MKVCDQLWASVQRYVLRWNKAGGLKQLFGGTNSFSSERTGGACNARRI